MISEIQYSPNYSKKTRNIREIKVVVIHYTGMQSKIASIKRLTNPKYKVSCHYLIDRKGKLTKLVDDNKIAWHAGKSKWKNFTNLNKNSIGIELVNKGHEFGYEFFPNLQIKKLKALCLFLKKKYKVESSNFVGHSDISPLRKIDPGEKFPWKKLSEYKIGTWYKIKSSNNLKLNVKLSKKLFFKNLYKIGYRYFNLKKIDKIQSKYLVKAFQSRYNPKNVSGQIDSKTLKISQFLAKGNKN